MEFTSETQKQVDEAHEIKNIKKIEAALFISARYLGIGELVEYTNINPIMLKELIEKLKELYSEKDSAIEIIEKNGMWKMDVKEEFHQLINRFATGSSEFSKAEQETLAVIAYKQPAKQSVIVKIRGNKAYDHIKHFIDVELLKSKKAGHTKELSLSENFYDYFNVEKNKNSEQNIKKEDALEQTKENGGIDGG